MAAGLQRLCCHSLVSYSQRASLNSQLLLLLLKQTVGVGDAEKRIEITRFSLDLAEEQTINTQFPSAASLWSSVPVV